MKNREVFLVDPSKRKLVNEGVASVNDDPTSKDSLDILRYELETFVCDGQYHKGLEHILNIYLSNLDQPSQPAVWVSGFFGSGKSHLVKMLRALWNNTEFPDGAKARGIAKLPDDIKAHLKELDVQSKRHGGLHAASGTLGSAGYESVRLSFLSIIFKSLGLPGHYPIAQFILYLKHEGLLEQMQDFVKSQDMDWGYELDNFYVSDGLYEGMRSLKPGLFASRDAWITTLNNRFPSVRDVSNDDLIKALGAALKRDKQFPLTLIVLDEAQMYIGPNSDRLKDLQETVEACSQQLCGKLLLICTGQTAITHTENLKKLEGRFTVRVELSDTDVDTVLRNVVLAKKPDAMMALEQVLEKNSGEISRHLAGSTLAGRPGDNDAFAKDYPILPARRRFWEASLKALDPTGTDSQLRNQLGMVHKAVQPGLDLPIGNVVRADFLYFDQANRLLQSSMLPRLVHEKTMKWIEGTSEEKLLARCCGLIFLIGKFPKDTGLLATADTLADLLVEDLNAGSGSLRSSLPPLLDKCELLIKVGNEYRIQTPESVAYNDLLRNQRNDLANQTHKIDTERGERIRSWITDKAKKLSLTQGNCKEARTISLCFDSKLPSDSGKRIYAWFRDGWTTDEGSVIADARQAGTLSPAVFVFIPKRSADDLRNSIIDFKAAKATLEMRPVPPTEDREGNDARLHIETIRQSAERRILEIMDSAFSAARVFQAGGLEIEGNDLVQMILEAAGNSLARLYPKFNQADNANWGKVYEKAAKGAPDALAAIGHHGETLGNPVCKEIHSYISGGKKGSDIREHFMTPPFGWSKDAIDGGLQVLLISGHVQARDERGQPAKPTALERRDIGKTAFKVETTTVTAEQKLQVRKILQKAECRVKTGEEASAIPQLLDRLAKMAESAGGDEPKPEKPSTLLLGELKGLTGNEQLVTMANRYDELVGLIDAWTDLARRISDRMPNWSALQDLLAHIDGLKDADVLKAQAEAISSQRRLLDEPDTVAPLVAVATQALREKLTELDTAYGEQFAKGEARLRDDPNWSRLDPEQREEIRTRKRLTSTDRPFVKVEDTTSVLETLQALSLSSLKDRIDALLPRFNQALAEAAAMLEPKSVPFVVPRRVLKTDADIEAWLKELREQLKKALGDGPVMIQ